MKSVLKYSFFCFFLLSSSLIYSQTEKRLLKEAEDAYKQGDKNNALNFYLKALEKNPENAETNYKIGVLYLEMIYKHRSLPYLEKAFALNPKISHTIHKYLGQSYHYNHLWDKAIEHYELCRSTLKHDDPFLKKLDRKIFECKNGKELMANPVEAQIIDIGNGVNTKYPEFAPVISADESVLIFTSRREGSTGSELDERGEYHEDIYISEKLSNGEWSSPQNIGTNINTNGHDASIGLSVDGKELFIYKDNNAGDIFFCKLKKDEGWSKPASISDNINSKHGETSVCISPDGSTIFFTSNMDGGFGGFDIYMSKADKKGNWGKPVNLGPVINTPEDEESPFLDFDGKTLHFSSRAHKGMGNYDIFRSQYDSTSNTWAEPENLGYPINTADDDIYFVLSGDGRHGYYASVREGGYGEKDIYMINMPPREDYNELVKKMEIILKKEIIPQAVVVEEVQLQPVILKGTVYDIKTKQTLSATVQLLDQSGNIVKEVITGEDGNYMFEVTSDQEKKYSVSASKDQYGFASKKVTTPATSTKKVELLNNLNLGKLEVGAKFILRNIYYDFDKAELKPESITELKKLLKMLRENPSMKVEIGSHTDNKGSNEYNIALSKRRAQSVVNWLVKNGIDKSRLASRGYGEDVPIASNDDEEEGRELNRRTEFEVISK
jgi:outer membrane protein OmpA-like peptidoglycan-associated protein